MNWILREDPGTPLWYSLPMEKCTPTRKHKFAFTICIYSRVSNHSRERLQSYRLEKLCEDNGYSYEWVSGRKPRLTKEEKTIKSKTDNFVPFLLFPGHPSVLEAIRQQHHCRICLQQIQPKSEVTDQFQETGTDHPQKPKTKIKRGMATEIRITVCEIFLRGWRSSQII